MLIYFVALIEALAYASAVPICVAFCLSLRDGLLVGAGIGAFDSRGALQRARRRMARGMRRRARARVNARQALGTLKRLKFERVCGGVTALASALRGRAASLEVDVAPLFDADAPTAELRGMIRARAGQIILAAARSGVSYISGRIAHGKAPD